MGSTSISKPTPPAAPTTADSVQAYTENMPQMIETQMEYAPQLAQQQFDIQSGLAPEYAQQAWDLQNQYAPMMAEQQQQLQQQYEPGAYNATQTLGGLMNEDYLTNYDTGGYGQGFDQARDRIKQDSRAAWAQRGLGQSGMSAEDETRMLSEFEFPYAMQQEQLRTQELGRRQNMGLSLSGRYAVPNVQGVSTPQVQTPSLMGGYDFGNVQSGMQQGYGNYSGAYSSMYGANAKLQANANNVNQQYAKMGMQGAGAIMMSDRKLKKDIVSAEDSLEKIEKLNPVEYKWKETGKIDGGVIAQELEEIMPDAVEEIDGIKHIKPMMIIGHLIGAVKELNEKIEQLS